MAYEKPNHTQIPNAFLDNDLATIKSLAELKITLAVLRNTIGFHRHEVKLDVPKLIALTGLSRQSVIEGIKLAIENDRIRRRAVGRSFAYEGSLTVKKVDYCNNRNSQEFCKEVDSKAPSPYIDLNKERKSQKFYKDPQDPPEPTYRIAEVKNPLVIDPDGSLRAGLKQLYPQFDFDSMYGKWQRSKIPKRGIGRRAGAPATVAEYRASVENYFQSCSENSQNGYHANGNSPQNGRLPDGRPAVKFTTAADIERMLRPS